MVAKVSVIVPVYKTEKYLNQCLDSLLEQKLSDIEIICVDDGSPDNSGKILDDYAKKDKRIRVIHQENKGLGAAYNAGMRVATGEYIGFLDSDDWVEPVCFQNLYAVAEKTNADVVKAGGYFTETEKKKELSIKIPANRCGKLIHNTLDIPEFVEGHVTQWTAIYKRSFLNDNNILCRERKKIDFTPDIAFVFKVWILAKSLYVIPAAYVHYRQHAGAATHQGSKMSFRLLEAHRQARDEIDKLSETKLEHRLVKSRVEYEHFMYDLDNRCKNRRLEFIREIAKIFRENLKKKYVDPRYLEVQHRYKMIANHPFFYWLIDTTHWWAERRPVGQIDTYWRLFGLYKRVENPVNVRVYILGIPVCERPNYAAQLGILHDKLNQVSSQLKSLAVQKKSVNGDFNK